MALVTCPECGQKNVSDSAQSCPRCGYNVREHFAELREMEIEKEKRELEEKEKEKQRKEEEKRQKEELKKKEKIARCPECNELFLEAQRICPHCGLSLDDKEALKRLKEIEKIENSLYDDSYLKNVGILTLSIIVFCLVFYFFITGDRSFESGLSVVTFLFFVVVAAVPVARDFSNKKKIKKDLELAKTNYDAYVIKRERKIQDMKKEINSMPKNVKPDTVKSTNVPKCPTCGSTHVRKISTTKKTASIVGFGILSNDIGKTYECLNCKYKW